MATPVVEDYLQVIHYFTRDGQPVIAARLAERLGVKPPTATATLQRMERDGLIEHGPKREILFTEEGRILAEETVSRHALAERLLTDLLKMPWPDAHEQSHGFEHAITPKVRDALLKVLGDPDTCPHGNPIPGRGTIAPGEFSLSDAKTGDKIRITRITEEAEHDPDLMRYLQDHDIGPGSQMTVAESTSFNALITLQGEKLSVSLGHPAAAKIKAVRR
jgi:DtxR family Mn-dependent transcriptional regulator